MTDKEVIEQFYTQISWKDKCQEIQYGNRTFIKSEVSIKVPTYYEEYGDGVDLAVAIASEFRLKPYLLLWGNATQAIVENIWQDSHRKMPDQVYTHWVPPYEDQAWWSNELTVRALEGIDWQRSLEQRKPVWSWDR